MLIELPWPSSKLSGHNNGNWRGKADIIADHRGWAFNATKEAKIQVPAEGDIPVSVSFYPPDNRSDRINFWNRMKPYFDGIADALEVNDSRFVPAGYHICDPVKGGKVEVTI